MSKRFTDTDKWKKTFLKQLPAEYKLFWLYLIDECDHAGIWHVELDLAEMRLGVKLSEAKAQGLFNGKVVVFDNGTKWFIPDFISFQYGELNEANRAHSSVVQRLKKYSLLEKIKPLTSPLQGAMDKDKDMVKDVLEAENLKNFKKQLLDDKLNFERLAIAWQIKRPELEQMLSAFEMSISEDHTSYTKYRSHFYNWGKSRHDQFVKKFTF